MPDEASERVLRHRLLGFWWPSRQRRYPPCDRQAHRAKLTFIDDSERNEPAGTVNDREAAGRASFLVAARVPEADGGGQRATHEGFFLTVDDADAYRQAQPDADALAVVVVHDRCPLRDLTPAELKAGEVDPAVDAAKGLTATIDRIYREARR